ncbi:MAG: hypothetical protein RJQ09_04745 [Cyclobacteriaceae bacterium]
MRIAVLTLCFVLASFYLSAQDFMEFDRIVTYSDGSTFRGKIVRSDGLQILLLATTGDTLHLQTEEIKRIKTVDKNVVLSQRGKFRYNQGLFALMDLGVTFNYSEGTILWDALVGYHLNEKYSVGIGTGFHINNMDTRSVYFDHDFVPVYAYGQKFFSNSNWAPFIFSKIGYGIATPPAWLRDDYSGGFYFQPGFGLQLASRSKFRLVLTLSNYLQHTTGTELRDNFFTDSYSVDYSVWYSRLIFKVGLEFK